MICLKTFETKTASDFPDWKAWIEFVNYNQEYARTKSEVFDFKGKCKNWELPSFHPYWAYVVKQKLKTKIELHEHRLIECKKDPGKIKYYYNSTTSLTDIVAKIEGCKQKMKG